jgi:hypothetical protein
MMSKGNKENMMIRQLLCSVADDDDVDKENLMRPREDD